MFSGAQCHELLLSYEMFSFYPGKEHQQTETVKGRQEGTKNEPTQSYSLTS